MSFEVSRGDPNPHVRCQSGFKVSLEVTRHLPPSPILRSVLWTLGRLETKAITSFRRSACTSFMT